MKRILSGLLSLVAVAFSLKTARAETAGASADAAATATATSIYEIPVEPMKGESTAKAASKTLAPFKGDVLLIVNVASKCGLTPQYEGLEALHRKYKDKGLRVIGFPSNDFKGQEPGTEEEIVQFCKSKYDVTFPLYGKINVAKGTDKAPLYQFLTEGDHPGKGEVSWNFNKFLIGRDGRVIKNFHKTKPDDPEFVKAIEAALAEPKS